MDPSISKFVPAEFRKHESFISDLSCQFSVRTEKSLKVWLPSRHYNMHVVRWIHNLRLRYFSPPSVLLTTLLHTCCFEKRKSSRQSFSPREANWTEAKIFCGSCPAFICFSSTDFATSTPTFFYSPSPIISYSSPLIPETPLHGALYSFL